MIDRFSASERDELASAYLDGEATQDEVVLVENNASMLELVEELRAVAEASSSPASTANSVTKAAHLAAAGSVFDAQLGAGSTTTDTDRGAIASSDTKTEHAAVTSLAAKRAKKQSQSTRRYPAWLSVAAASLAVVGGIGLYRSTLTSDSEDAAFATAEESGESDDSAGAAMDFAEDTRALDGASTRMVPEAAMQESASSDTDTPASDQPEDETDADSAVPEAAEGDEEATTLGQDPVPAANPLAVFSSDTPLEEILLELQSGPGALETFCESAWVELDPLLQEVYSPVGLLQDDGEVVLVEILILEDGSTRLYGTQDCTEIIIP